MAELPNGLPFHQYRIPPGPNRNIIENHDNVLIPGSRYTQVSRYAVRPPLANDTEMALQALFQRIRENVQIQRAQSLRIRVVRQNRETLVTRDGRTRVFRPHELMRIQAYMNFRDTVLMMFSSNDDIDFDELDIYIDMNMGLRGGAGEPQEEYDWLKERRGITLIPRANHPNLCGWLALACYVALIDERYVNHHHGLTRMNLLMANYEQWCLLARTLHGKYGDPDDMAYSHPDCTERFLEDHPDHRVVVVEGKQYRNYAEPVIVDMMQGSMYQDVRQWEYDRDVENGGMKTFYLWIDRLHSLFKSNSLPHFHFIHHPDLFFRNNQNAKNRRFCQGCFRNYETKNQKFQNHVCSVAVCEVCQLPNIGKAIKQHQAVDEKVGMIPCGKCGLLCFNANCKLIHEYRCSGPIQPFNSKPYCTGCKIKIEPGEEHMCYLGKKELFEEFDPAFIEEKNAKFYVFDFESEFIAGNSVRRKREGEWVDMDVDTHRVNYVVVQQCGTGDIWEFENLEGFVKWMREHPSPGVLLAHNMKGYDGRLLFNYLLQQECPPSGCMWVGNKIMAMKVFKWRVQDTLTHLTFALEQLPKIFGLNENEFKKGYFPYKFNIPDNRNYVGPVPDIHYFEPDMMRPEKRRDFIQWYREECVRQGDQYDFWKELQEYCRSDVKILAKAMEVYMTEGMMQNGLNPMYKYTIAAYAQEVYLTYHMPEKSLIYLSKEEEEFARRALHGGRTDVRCMFRSWSEEDVAQGVYGCYQDVQSLYPTVQFYKPMPVGRAKILKFDNTQPTLAEVRSWFGFVECDLSVDREMFHPVVVGKDPANGKLMADLRDKTRIVLTTAELHMALDNGYVLIRVHEAHVYEKSYDLFKSYIRTFLKLKIESSGMPDHIKNDDQWNAFHRYHFDELGVDLKRDQMVKNAGRKQLAKLMLNSLWGKFAERTHNTYYKVIKKQEEMLGMELKWDRGDIDVVYRHAYNDGTLIMVYKELNQKALFEDGQRQQTNVALASFVTAWGALILWEQMHLLGDRVLYHDTDSIIYERSPSAYNIPLGKYLGEWEDETGGLPIVAFVSTGPKTYAYIVREPDHVANDQTLEGYRKSGLDFTIKDDGKVFVTKHVCKAKGFTLNTHNAARINFTTMHKLLLERHEDKPTPIQASSLKFVYRRGQSMHTEKELKLLEYCYDKGYVDDQFKVWPWGYDRFRTWRGPRLGWVQDDERNSP